MAIDVIMPQMGADMTEGTLVRWLKQLGEQVNRGDILAEIETDKATVELEAFESGVLRKLVVQEGETVPVGQVIAVLGGADEAVEAAPAAEPERKPLAQPAERRIDQAAANTAAPRAAAEPAGDSRVRISPVARRIANDAGIDPATVTGTGPDGRVLRRDIDAAVRDRSKAAEAEGEGAQAAPAASVGGTVTAAPTETGETEAAETTPDAPAAETAEATPDAPEAATAETTPAAPAIATAEATPDAPAAAEAAAEASPDAPAAAATEGPAASTPKTAPAPARATGQAFGEVSRVEPLSRMRQTIARRMSQSKQQQPHYYLTLDIDMTSALAFREQVNTAASEAQRVSINDMVVKACAIALVRHPKFNAEFSEEGLRFHPRVNVDIAIALDEGLIAPAILDCAEKSLGKIAEESKDLVARAKSGHLRADEYAEGTFSITNLGAFGVETLIGIIKPPQAAILGVGSVLDQAVVRDGQVVARKVMKVALSADHRVSDGAEGARFIKEIQAVLENPASMAL